MLKKTILLSVLTLFVHTTCQAASYFVGTTPVAEMRCYLYNVYQAKFLNHGNHYDTQASLINSSPAPMNCTLVDAGDGKFYIQSNYDSKANKLYVGVNDSVWVDNIKASKDAQAFTCTAVDGGYTFTYVDGGVTKALMFDRGTMVNVADISTGFNADKAIWRIISEDEYNTYEAKNRFTIASMNVDGMPQTIKIAGVYSLSLNPDGRQEEGATLIGNRLRNLGYDIVGVSENFNYNYYLNKSLNNDSEEQTIYASGTHRGGINLVASTYTKFLANTSPLFDVDGMNLYWKKSAASTSGESWTAWNEHYGYTDSGADGMIDKGYRYYTVTLTDGTEIDVYILHMDAETNSSDIVARESQLTQLATAIKASNNGRPIIVMGDTNCRYTRDRLKVLFVDVLNADSRFTVHDLWVDYGRDGIYPSCNGVTLNAGDLGYRRGEVVDKMFYINNTESSIRIQPISYHQDLSFIDSDGESYSDHWPAVGEFEYHTYDPAVDDEIAGNLDGVWYLRNKETGAFLKAGGWWGTHAVQGRYGKAITITQLSNGKYHLAGVTQDNPFMDNADGSSWILKQDGNYYSFTYDDNGTTKALTGNDPTFFPDEPGPNTRYVTCATYSANDDYQKWELLSLDDLNAEMLGGTSDSPYNCTYLMKCANFDRNDADGTSSWSNDITSSATRMTSNLSDGKNDFAFGNSCAETFVAAKGNSSNSSVWDINQTLTNLPNGKYRITAQAFQRINYSTSTTENIYVYGNDVTVDVPLMYTEPKITDSSFGGTTQSDGYYYPNSMAEATLYFNAGYYQTSLDVTVTNGTLKIGVKKTSTTDTSNSAWTCFDNFQLYYLGNESATLADGGSYYIYNVDGGAFLGKGNIWGTQATLVTTSNAVQWTAKNQSGDLYKLDNGSGSAYLGITDEAGAWVDRSDANTAFQITKGTDNYYRIAIDPSNDTYGTSKLGASYFGWIGDSTITALHACLPTIYDSYGTRWALYTSDQYTALNASVDAARTTRLHLWPVVRAARESGIIYDDFEKVWSNPASTSNALITVANKLRDYLLERTAQATSSSPVYLSYLIKDADNYPGDEKTYSWPAGYDKFGDNTTYFHTSGTSSYVANHFFESWTASPGSLLDKTISQTITDLPAGTYKLGLDAISVLQSSDGTTITGVNLFATVGSTTQKTALSTRNGLPQYFETPEFIIDEDGGSVTIGLEIKSTNANWVAFDNWKLIYLHSANHLLEGGDYYLYNVDAGQFLTNDNQFNTQASLGTEGIKWTLALKDDAYTLYQSVAKNTWNADRPGYLYIASNGTYVDSDIATNWVIDGTKEDICEINLDGESTTLLGWPGDPGNTVVWGKLMKLDVEPRGTRWKFMTQAEYDANQSTLAAALSARQSAWPIIRSAKLNNLTEITEYTNLMTAYDDVTKTADDITPLAAALKSYISSYAKTNGSLTNMIDVSYNIKNAGMGDDPTVHTGWAVSSGEWSSNISLMFTAGTTALVPRFYEKWVAYPNTVSDASISQELTSLPAGTYVLRCDVESIRQGDNEAVTGVTLYAKVGDNTFETNCSTGDNIEAVSTPTIAVPEGETVEIGLKINGTNANWVAYDNWKLLYLGKNLYTISDMVASNDRLILQGVWDANDTENLKNIIAAGAYNTVDITQASLSGISKLTVTPSSTYPNLITWVNAGDSEKLTNTSNVVDDKICKDLIITDKKNFGAPEEFTATKVEYTRSGAAGYNNSYCMPFEVPYDQFANVFGAGSKVYIYKGLEQVNGLPTLNFTEITSGTLAKGTPCIVYSTQDWKTSDYLSNVGVCGQPYDDGVTGTTSDDYDDAPHLYGSFLKKTLGTGLYKLSSDGNSFVHTTEKSTVTPFRIYMQLEAKGDEVKEFYINLWNEDDTVETAIGHIESDGQLVITGAYDLSGRKINSQKYHGIMIRDGHKVLNK